MKDKIIHALVCFFAVLLVFSLMHIFFPVASSVAGALLFAFGLGIGKEVGDWLNPNSRWDWKDLIADLVGCGVAMLVIIVSLITGFVK